MFPTQWRGRHSALQELSKQHHCYLHFCPTITEQIISLSCQIISLTGNPLSPEKSNWAHKCIVLCFQANSLHGFIIFSFNCKSKPPSSSRCFQICKSSVGHRKLQAFHTCGNGGGRWGTWLSNTVKQGLVWGLKSLHDKTVISFITPQHTPNQTWTLLILQPVCCFSARVESGGGGGGGTEAAKEHW